MTERENAIDESLLLLSEVSSYLSERDVDFMFFEKAGYNKRDVREEIDGLFKKYHVDKLSLNITMVKEFGFGEGDGHLSQSGHKEVARNLYEALIDSVVPNMNLSLAQD